MAGTLLWLYDEVLLFPLTFIIFTAGLFLTVRLSLLQGRHFFTVMRSTIGEVLRPAGRAAGEISPFQAFATAMAGTLGTGNIVGVATAIFLGGPGAIFWMWLSAFLGMATKYSEIVLAVHYRAKLPGGMAGGPMYFLERGLKMPFLALLFAVFGSMAAFGIGNMVQANSVAGALQAAFGLSPYYSGLALALLGGLVILGGIRRIAAVASALIPIVAVFYLTGAIFILFYFRSEIPAAFTAIFTAAFQGRAAAGGLAGVAVLQAWRYGIARGVFTNEAGLGSASIAHAVARTAHPARQGMWGMLEVFMDTHVLCTVTALVLLVTGAAQSGLEGAAMTVDAYSRGLPGSTGQYIVAVGLAFFAFSTLLSWCYYGEKCFEYIMGGKGILFYRLLWLLAIPVGALGGLRTVWAFADILNGLMALPNLIGLVGLSGVIARLTREYFGR